MRDGIVVSAEEEKTQIREKISAVESVAKSMEQLEIKESHYFSKKVYAREIFIPKGTLIVGKIHKYENLNIVSAGKVNVISIDGLMHIEAPFTFVGSPGTKRIIYALEDTTWTTIHGTDERELEKIENEFIAKTYDDVVLISEDELRQLKEKKWHG